MSPLKHLNHLRIPFRTIKSCTKNFSETHLIGEGGYGRVYKGTLAWANYRNKQVAVKQLHVTARQGKKEFYSELTILSRHQHKNIINFVGFCDDNNQMILVYEYACRGSLDAYLNDSNKLDLLSWEKRLEICIGVASAIDYLHNHVAKHYRVIHCDIKSANILLDEEWNPKLSDFGLSRIGLANQANTFVITTAAGTPGYCDPQYRDTGILTKEADVYSFGVVLFEVLCRRMECLMNFHGERRFFHHVARTYYEEGNLDKIVDYRIKEHIKGTELSEFSAIAYQCLQDTREKRPTIHSVVLQLTKLRKTQDTPRRLLKKFLRGSIMFFASIGVGAYFVAKGSSL